MCSNSIHPPPNTSQFGGKGLWKLTDQLKEVTNSWAFYLLASGVTPIIE